MEKRLPLFLFLSFLLYFGYVFYGPRPEVPQTATGATPAATPGDSVSAGSGAQSSNNNSSGADSQPTVPALVGTRLAAEEPQQSGPLIFGRSGEPGYIQVRFSNKGGRLTHLRFGDYFDKVGLSDEDRAQPEHWLEVLRPVDEGERESGSMLLRTSTSSKNLALAPLDEELWRMQVLRDSADQPLGVEFELAPGTGVRFVKRIKPIPGTWRLAVELELHNEAAGSAGNREFVFVPAGSVPPELDDNFYREPKAVAAGPIGPEIEVSSEEKNESGRDLIGALDVRGPLAFAGVHNKYFAVLMHEPQTQRPATMLGANYRRVYDAVYALQNPSEADESMRFINAEVQLSLQLPAEGEQNNYRYEIYAGPKEHDAFLGDDLRHELVTEEDLNWFASISKLLLWILGKYAGLVGNWGVAIILLTLTVRGVLFPMTRRSQTAMARYQSKMKRVQPKLNEIKEKYKDDAQKLRQEQAKIMQEEGAFPPLGGCLPMFLQMPVFFGLFSALRTSFDLRQEGFAGWISDLSRPDRLIHLDFDLNLLITTLHIEYLNILPLLMVVLWILQQRSMPAPADEQAAKMQKMMMWMPVMMGVFLYNYAAGLSLYMITQSGLGIFEQKFIKKRWPIDDAELERKPKKSGCGPFSGMMENMAEKHKEQVKRLEAAQRQKSKSGGSKKNRKKR